MYQGPTSSRPLGNGRGDSRRPVRLHRQHVLEQDRLAVEHESRVGVAFQEVEQVTDRGDEAGQERSARQVPLAVPVGMSDQVKREPLVRAGHRLLAGEKSDADRPGRVHGVLDGQSHPA